jgi:hypothetical protein
MAVVNCQQLTGAEEAGRLSNGGNEGGVNR